ncbi:MAG: radical SAM protein [Candidatus Omnitrophica bacterium]|nr:radical SAM protein [Candidatus Omnitrophota bacterium]
MPRLLYADKKGRIFEEPELEAAAMKAGRIFRIDPSELIELPKGSQLFVLPERQAIGYYGSTDDRMISSGRFAVAAFLAPGYTATYSPAYIDDREAKILPLFSYCAAVSYKGKIYVTAIRVDSDKRHNSQFISITSVKRNAKNFKKIFPGNRLIGHLETCALTYGCPNAQNFFLSRYECPLPTAPVCNASCAGCISYQSAKDICATQPRIKFVPKPAEIAGIALYHIGKVKNAIVSFGQGCEGEPLTQAGVVEEAIHLIKGRTHKGIINLNTNGSRPDKLERLIDAGLDSVRISLNSARVIYYTKYYRPVRYNFADVVSSIKTAKKKRVFVSLNYLTMPGFTDLKDEYGALRKLVSKTGVDMIQWRNLNYDPIRYFKLLKVRPVEDEMIGIKQEMELLKKEFPKLRMGYFNPFLPTL